MKILVEYLTNYTSLTDRIFKQKINIYVSPTFFFFFFVYFGCSIEKHYKLVYLENFVSNNHQMNKHTRVVANRKNIEQSYISRKQISTRVALHSKQFLRAYALDDVRLRNFH